MSLTVNVIYGTESGNAEMVADDLAEALTERGIDAAAKDMTDVDVATLAGPALLVVVCSTYEEGELPASAQPFHAALRAERPDLTGVRFAAFGLGDSSYAHFGEGIDIMANALNDLGAERVGVTAKHDALSAIPASELARDWCTELFDTIVLDEARAARPSDNAACADELFPWNDKDFQENPYPYYARARGIAPVHRAGERTYVVTRYDDVMAHVKAPVMSIKEPEWARAGGTSPFSDAFINTVLGMDPPEHAKARRLFSRWFTPKLIKQWVAYTREALEPILDGYVPGDRIDGHFDLGAQPTHITMARVLDLPPGEVEPLFWALWDAMLIQATNPPLGTLEKSIAGLEYMFTRTEALLREKVTNPGHGLADELIATHQRGEISWREVLENVVNFYMSGAPNPAYLIGSAIEVFANHPDVMRQYRDRPEIREKVVNEVARLNPVELLITRFPTEDIEICGVTIPKDSEIKFPIGAVNRDPEVFPNPDEFDYNRPLEASRNLSFGLGTHACAGQFIARAETEMILALVSERFSAVKLLEDPVRVRTDRLVAYQSLPVALF